MSNDQIRKIAILTGGGDCPGLNAVIRAVAKTAMADHNISVVGILDSYWGLVSEKFNILHNQDVSGILHLGGTILGTSRIDPFKEAYRLGMVKSENEDWEYIRHILKRHGIDAIVAVGGEGTMRVAARGAEAGIPIVGVPKTIDNDIDKTDFTFGFDSAVSIVMNALDNLHSTAQSHHRAMVVEVMGRTAGWLALFAGVAGGGDALLIPEIPFREEAVFEMVLKRQATGKRFSIIVAAEGAKRQDGGEIYSGDTDASGRKLLGGVGEMLAKRIEEATRIESRVTVLGHLQRGGSPTAYDRVLATRFGHAVVDLVIQKKWGHMVALHGQEIEPVTLKDATAKVKLVPPNHPLLTAARALGTAFGDE